MYYLCSENKGADQLRGNREADLRLCFRICKKPVFSGRGSFDANERIYLNHSIFHKNISCGYSFEAPRQGTSIMSTQNFFFYTNKIKS